MKILVIEDDPLVANTLVAILARQNYAVEVAVDGESGWELLTAYEYDLVILDLTLPHMGGMELCQRLRDRGNQSPVLILTGCNHHHDKIVVLDAGADDYMLKPFDPDELLARVRALLRRSRDTTQLQLRWGDLQLDPTSCQVTYRDRLVPLTPKEYALTELFLRHPKRVFSCSAILDHLWTYEEAPGEEAVRTHIKGLRQKLKAASEAHDMVETVYGIGYRLRAIAPEPIASEPIASEPIASEPQALNQPLTSQPPARPRTTNKRTTNKPPIVGMGADDQQLAAAMQRIWLESQSRVQAQLVAIAQAIEAAAQNTTAAATLMALGEREAHTLAGALGTFGFAQGTEWARSLEAVLQLPLPLNAQQIKQLQQDFDALKKLIMMAQQLPMAGESVQLPLANEPVQSQSRSQLRLELPVLEAPAAADLAVADSAVADSAVAAALKLEPPTLLVVDTDAKLIKDLLQEPIFQAFHIEFTKHLNQTKARIQALQPQVILFDPDVATDFPHGMACLRQLQQNFPTLPIVIFTAHTALLERQNLLQSGDSIFLAKPATMAQILDAIGQAQARVKRLQSKILVVDDDQTILALTQQLLEQWGLAITTLADPQQFWSVLERVQPDLLILDIVMPEINGIELCKMVRSDARWSELPIVFLTVAQDAAMINQVFSAGADDFVAKPIAGPELVTRVINRLERTKLRQQRYLPVS
jgi:DNA-binding response OmpR family regulator/HPt (histidine-containing phosphotransfer) domain-containing protein